MEDHGSPGLIRLVEKLPEALLARRLEFLRSEYDRDSTPAPAGREED